MSEKKAKQQRQAQPKIKYKMILEVVDLENGTGQIRVSGMPADFNDAIKLLTDGIKIVTTQFVKAAQEGNVDMQEPKRIIPAHSFVPGGGRA